MLTRSLLKLFWIVTLALWAGPLAAQSLLLTDLPQATLGRHAGVLRETGAPLGIEDIQAAEMQRRFQPGTSAVLSFGIGAAPAWIHLPVTNPTPEALAMRLTVGTTWLDQVEVFVLQDHRVSAHWRSGDELAGAPGLQPGIGFVFEPRFAPGPSDIYIRVESVDPLALPIALQTLEQAETNQKRVHYSYGIFYGFLIALIAYNGMLFLGLKDLSYLYYSLYLIAMIGMNMAYTGHGLAWVWPGQLLLQRYVILGLMVLFASSGLLFADRFLLLKAHARRLHWALPRISLAVMAVFALCVLLGSHHAAVIVAFAFAAAFTVAMVLLGLLAVRQGRSSGYYFLGAVCCGMVGAIATLLVVLGWLAFSPLSFRAVEIGVVLEATLLALALTAQMRQHQHASAKAEHLANHDPLTGLHNRRAFLDRARSAWSTAQRGERPLSLIMLDLDHFKQINDVHGHEVGDQALVHSAGLLAQACRAGDLLARWGGEEFILLLPETGLEQACAFAERLRQQFAAQPVVAPQATLAVTASLGVVQLGRQANLEALIKDADLALYQAKHGGRDRVSTAHRPHGGSSVAATLTPP